jgi:hypothetical protein
MLSLTLTCHMIVHVISSRTLVASLTGREDDAWFLPLDRLVVLFDEDDDPGRGATVNMPLAMARQIKVRPCLSCRGSGDDRGLACPTCAGAGAVEVEPRAAP